MSNQKHIAATGLVSRNNNDNNLKYRGYFNSINKKPQDDEWIQIFVSDWNKDHYAFYVNIGLKTHETDIDAINKLIQELNWRDGDIYIELIDHSDGLKELYYKFYDDGYFTHESVLHMDKWQYVKVGE